MDKISIIVPVYNTSRYLPQCLDSLINQTYRNLEIICINDGSTDDSLQVLRKYEKDDSRILVVDQKNAGLSGARNSGVAVATGNWLMFVDSDDWVDVKICEDLMVAAETYSADCVMCSYCKDYGNRVIENHIFEGNMVWNETDTREKFYRRLFGPIGDETARPHDVDIIVSVCMQLFRADICKNVTFIDTKKVGTEDCLYQMMVYRDCKVFVYVDKPYYHYRKTNATSLTTKYNPNLFERWQNMYAMMEDMIRQDQLPPIYQQALNNRILFALIGLGLNEVTAKTTLHGKAARMKFIISGDRYQNAFRTLEVRRMQMPWKVFFILLKNGMILPVVLMLELIQRLRGR